MGLFSRRRASSRTAAHQREAIDAFWTWWQAGGAASTAAAVDAGRAMDVADDLSEHVRAVHQELGWELGPGRSSRHLLMVTAEGNPDLRAVAGRWRREAPPPNDVWEYADARQAAPDLHDVVLELDGTSIPAADVQVAARVNGAEVDVGLYHAALADLDDERRKLATFLLLDQALGEVDVELWIGAVETLTLAPLDPIPLTTLPAVVRQVEEQWRGDDGTVGWALGEGTDDRGRPVIITVQVPLKSASAPHLDHYVGVSVPFSGRTEEGLPDEESLEALRRFEDHLVRRLGDSGRLVAHQTCDGSRLLHLYVDGTTPAVDQLRAAVSGWDQGRVGIVERHDPGWEAVGPLRP